MPLPNTIAFSDLGGEIKDFSPPVNSATDLAAAFDNKSRAAVSEMSASIDHAWVKITLASNAATLNDCGACWDASSDNTPDVAWTHTGTWEVTFPSTIVDQLGNTIAIALKGVSGHSVDWSGASGPGFLSAKVTDANKISFLTYNSSAALNDMIGAVVFVKVL